MRVLRRVSLCALALWLAYRPAAADESLEGSVLVADETYTLEHVLEEALVARRPDRVVRFWVVITGDQVRLATKANGMRDRTLAKGFDLLRQHGGIVYACETDMNRLGIAAGELLPPAEPVKGFDAGVPMDADQRLYAGEDPQWMPQGELQLRRLRAACSQRP